MLLKTEALDPRVQRTRQLLQEAFEELLSVKSFDRVSVRDITEKAGINRATFYAHFTDKYHLLNYAVQVRFQTALDHHLPGEPGFTENNLALLVRVTCEFLGQFIDHCSPLERQNPTMILEIQVQKLVYAVLMAWLQPAANRIPPENIATVISWSIMGIARLWTYGNRKQSLDDVVGRNLPLIVQGIEGYLIV